MSQESTSDEINEIKKIKIELSDLTKSVRVLSSQFDQMNSLLIQLLTSLDLTDGDYSDEEALDYIQNEKLLSRIKDMRVKDDNHVFQ